MSTPEARAMSDPDPRLVPASRWSARLGHRTFGSEPPRSGLVSWWVRSVLFDVLAFLVGALLLRLVIGRWPNRSERRRFRLGLHRSVAPLPPLLKGICAVPAAQPNLTRSMLLAWLLSDETYRGVMRRGLGSEQPPGDHLRIWTKPPVSFLHLEKTAGTSVIGLLAPHFHPVQIDHDPHRSMPPHLLAAFPTHAARNLAGAALVHGHYDLPALRRLGRDRFVFTMLREPRARILSLYYFWRSIDPGLLGPPDQNRNVRFAHEHGLLGFLQTSEPFIVDYIDNFYLRRLTGFYASTSARDPLVEAPAECLQIALDALRSIDFVGVTERTGKSLEELGRMLGLDPSAEIPTLNEAAANHRTRPHDYRHIEPQPVTPEIEAALDRLTRLDRTLYETSLERFRQSRHGLGRVIVGQAEAPHEQIAPVPEPDRRAVARNDRVGKLHRYGNGPAAPERAHIDAPDPKDSARVQ